MMNKSKMGFCDFTFNPVAGCRTDCEYCYAARQAQRFSGDIRINKGSDQLKKDEYGLYTLNNPFKNPATGRVTPHPVGFEPVMHKYRLPMLKQKKKPANILVCSLADLFGPWVPDSWIKEVFNACEAAPWHNYLFMTRYPQRYEQMSSVSRLPASENFWYGTTITRAADLERLVFLPRRLHRQFVSIEPLLEEMDISDIDFMDWIIIGAETGNRRKKVVPKKEWIKAIVKAAKDSEIPVFMKHSRELEGIWGGDLIQELPTGLTRPEDKPIPHCRECEYCKITQEGKRGNRHECQLVGRHIPGRYSRISPLWCPLRSE